MLFRAEDDDLFLQPVSDHILERGIFQGVLDASLHDGLVYFVDDGGIASCVESKTGKDVWRQRIGGNYSASPLYADGRIYFFSEDGTTTVIAPGREFKKLAENKLDGGFMASPAVSGKALILRTKTHLYRVEQPKGN